MTNSCHLGIRVETVDVGEEDAHVQQVGASGHRSDLVWAVGPVVLHALEAGLYVGTLKLQQPLVVCAGPVAPGWAVQPALLLPEAALPLTQRETEEEEQGKWASSLHRLLSATQFHRLTHRKQRKNLLTS